MNTFTWLGAGGVFLVWALLAAAFYLERRPELARRDASAYLVWAATVLSVFSVAANVTGAYLEWLA